MKTKSLHPLRERWDSVALLAALEAASAWSVSAWVAHHLALPFRAHPEGGEAVFLEGGRLALDLFFHHRDAVMAAANALVFGVGSYALLSVLLAGLLPSALGRPRRVAAHVALAAGVLRAPALVVLALVALLGYGLAALVAWTAARSAFAATATSIDGRAGDIWPVVAALPGLLLGYLVRVWYDVAVVHAVAGQARVWNAARRAVDRLVREPVGTLGVYAAVASGSLFLSSIDALAMGAVRPPAGPAVIVLMVVQLAVLVARVCLRALWVAHLTRPWRTCST